MVYYDDELDVFDVYHVAKPKALCTIEHSSSPPSHNQVGNLLDRDRHTLNRHHGRPPHHDHHDDHRHHHKSHHRGENAIPAAALAFSGALASSIANLATFPLEVVVKRMQTQRQIYYAHGGRSRRSRSHRKKGNTSRSSSSSSSSSGSHRRRSHSRTRTGSRGGSPLRSDDRRGRRERGGSHSRKTEEHVSYTAPYVEHGAEGTKVVWEARHYESSSEEYYDGFFETVGRIYAREGISGFYTGAVEETAGVIGSTFVHIMIHHYLRNKRLHSQHARKLPIIEEILIGIAAGSAAKFISTPFSTIVTRKQTHSLMYPDAKPPTITDIFYDVMREKGITGFWSGYSAGLLLTLNPTITYLLYEGLKRVAGGKQKKLKGGETFLLAAVSKAIATGITYPLAVAKSRTQIQAEEEDIAAADMNIVGKAIKKGLRRKVKRANNVVHVLIDIFKREGITALYEGVMVEITRGFVSNGISVLIKESVHRTILSLYYFVMRAYNRADDHSFRSTTRILAKDAYDDAGHKRKKLVGGAVGAADVVKHGVEAGRSKVSSVIEGGRGEVGHIEEKIVERTPLVGKHNNRNSHHLSRGVKLGAAAAAGAAAAHLKSRHKRQERRDQQEGHAAYGEEAVVHTNRHERREQHEGHSAHGGDFVSHTKRQERRDQLGGHAVQGGGVVALTKEKRVAEWRDGVNKSMADAPINGRFGKTTGHQGHVITATGAISDAAFHNQFARSSDHQSRAVNFTGPRNRFEDEVRMSDHSRTGLVENVDVRELRDDRIHTGEMTVIEDHRHGRGHGDGLIGSHTRVEKTTINGGHEHGHGPHDLAHIGRSSHHAGHDHLTDARIHSGETSFHEERGRGHGGMSNRRIRGGGGGSFHKEGFNGLADSRIITEKTAVREEHEHGASHGRGHSHGHSNSLVRLGKSSRHSGQNDFLDSRDSHMHSGKAQVHERHNFSDHSDSQIHRGKPLGGARHGGFVESRTRSENVISHEGKDVDVLTDSRFQGDKLSHHESRSGLGDTRIIERAAVHKGHTDSHGQHGSVSGVLNNALAAAAAIGANIGSAAKQAVTGHGSHHGHKYHHRSHSHGHEHDRHGKSGEIDLYRRKSAEWQDDKLSDSNILNGHSRDHRGKHNSNHSNHRTGISSDSRTHFEFEAEQRHDHKSNGGRLGRHTDERIKEAHITKFANDSRTDEALRNPGFLRPGPTPYGETRKEVFRDSSSRTSGVHGPLGAPGERIVKNQESTWVDNISSAAGGGAVKKVKHVEETWDIDDDNHTEVYNFMEEKRKAVPVSENRVITEQKWWNTSSGERYK
ncbi:unnamed protein product [Tuber aestivum]|uniref:Mitochondrial carrier n=1 Tax=Tuber aestivum TaxID=59557 RepID=A0A292PWN3_9PEZI|nr:unnamed protein product [Tuber aestivum]